MEKWNCDNGCDYVGYAGDFFQMSSPDGNLIKLVCRDCVYDRELEDWNVDLESDPRYTVYSMSDDVSTLTFYNGVITKSPA